MGFFDEIGQTVGAVTSGDWGKAWEQRDPLSDWTGFKFSDPYGVDFTKGNIKERLDALQGKDQGLGYKAPELDYGTKGLMQQRRERAGRTPQEYESEIGLNVDKAQGLITQGSNPIDQAIAQAQMSKLEPDLTMNRVKRSDLAQDRRFGEMSYAAKLENIKTKMSQDLQNRYVAATAAQNSARANIIGGLTRPLFQAVGTVAGGYFGGAAGAQAGGAVGQAGGAFAASGAGQERDLNAYGGAANSGKYYL